MRFLEEVQVNRLVRTLSGLMLIGLLSTTNVCLSAELIWTKKADMPTPRMSQTSARVNGRIYVIGGASSEPEAKALSGVEEYDPSTNAWTRKADMPTARGGLPPSSAVVDGRIYVMGGLGSSYQTLSTVEAYDPVKDKWTKKTDMPTARCWLATCAVGGRVYAIGGLPSGGGAGLKTLEVYDPETDTWTKKADMPMGQYGPCANVVKGKIYVVGGRPVGSAAPYVQQYDPATDIWTRKGDMLAATSSMGSVVMGDKIVVVGGWEWSASYPYETAQMYDPAKDLWTREADAPFLKAIFSAEVVNNRIYAIGGTDRPHPCLATSTVYESGLLGDFNGDGKVDAADMTILVANWGKNQPLCDIGPFAWGDGVVDEKDLKVLMESLMSPGPKASDVLCDAILSWVAPSFAPTCDVYFGTSFEAVSTASRTDPQGVLVSQGQTARIYDPAGLLEYSRTYYRRVDFVIPGPTPTIYPRPVLSFTTAAFAYPIKNVSAKASSAQADSGPEKTVNGSGLDKSDGRSTEVKDMSWSKAAPAQWIQYESDKVYMLHEMWVWNFNLPIEPVTGVGARAVKIEYSTDGTTWAPLANVPEFARASGQPGYAAITTVSFGGVSAKFVKLPIERNWGGAPQTGLSEVRFFYVRDGAPVEP